MIVLRKMRLINWYAFTNVTAPIGEFTLIAGKNGNGKSVLLDAIKYAAYGDVVFNKSSESKGARTLSSYTRGLLDATAGTYMRPADKMPNVYTHIVMEYFDEVEDKPFVLGTVIETNAASGCQTLRYACDRHTLEEITHTYEENGEVLPYSAAGLQKRYHLTMLGGEQGLQKFLQMTGMKMSVGQLPTYRRKLRSIMSYDPDARVDRFIRESVLEERNVDFAKLIEAKENIGRLSETFRGIEEEIGELNQILEGFDTWESEKNRLLTDDIKQTYKKVRDLRGDIDERTQEKETAQRQRQQLQERLETLEERGREINERLLRARVSLQELDCMKMIAEQERHVTVLQEEKRQLARQMEKLEQLQTKVSELLHLFAGESEKHSIREEDASHEDMAQTAQEADAGREDTAQAAFMGSAFRLAREERTVLASLCETTVSALIKEQAVEKLRRMTEQAQEALVKRVGRMEAELEQVENQLRRQLEIAEEYRRRRGAYDQIPEYVGLRDEINREFARRGIREQARFACEYVIGLKEEAWRDALESFLGPRRYTILVEPQYYDVADEVLNHSSYRYAHLFNTKLLMRKKVEVEEDSAVRLLDIRNPVAQRYFDWQLGRMHAVALEQVREYENAIAQEGRVSVAMDSYFLRFDRLRAYYLGQETFELNRRRAEREAARLQESKKELLAQRAQTEARKGELSAAVIFLRQTYLYDAHAQYQRTAAQAQEAEKQLRGLQKAQRSNGEFLELTQAAARLEKEQEAARVEERECLTADSRLETVIRTDERLIAEKSELLEKEQERYRAYETEFYPLVQKAVEAYERYLAGGRTGAGGLLQQQSRVRLTQRIDKARNDLIAAQSAYLTRHGDSGMEAGLDNRSRYSARRQRIQMDNMQEIRRKLQEQTQRYEDIFKNEFVLTILKSCERAREDLKEINYELSKLGFASQYQFEVEYVKDGSEFSRILRYARYLDEREQLGEAPGQGVLPMLTSFSAEEGEALEADLQQIINRIMEQGSEETIRRFADYRNYMTYEILITNEVLNRARLSRQTGYNSGAEVQIPYMLILLSALLLIYNQRTDSTRFVFIDEPFAKMDPGNVKLMLDFMKKQRLQVLFCAPDKTETIGGVCEVVLPVLRVRPERMELGIVQFHDHAER